MAVRSAFKTLTTELTAGLLAMSVYQWNIMTFRTATDIIIPGFFVEVLRGVFAGSEIR